MDPLDAARHLIEHGVPVFVAEPDPSGGHSGTGFRFPRRWQQTEPDLAVLEKWEEGKALCAVMGHVVDALDLDPRNGGELTGVEFPRSYGQQRTPSGGTHDLIASLGVQSKDGVQPGVDVKAGVDGRGHGFIFIAPTVKLNKETGELVVYEWEDPPNLSNLLIRGDNSGAELKDLIKNGRRVTAEGPEYDGLPYEKLTEDQQRQADEHVSDVVYDWKIRLADASGWDEDVRDGAGRGWEALVRDCAWSLAILAACPWTALDEPEARQIYAQILPDAIADDPKCQRKWYDGLVEKAAAEPIQQPPWWSQIFFEQTQVLRHIKQAAHSRGVSSLALLACILGRVLLRTSPAVTLPPVVGSRASLNLGLALVGDSGTTKSSSDNVAEELLGEVASDWVLPIGSGEGMIDSFLEPEMVVDDAGKTKPTGNLVQVSDPHRMFLVDEGETLARLAERSGSTGGSFLRSALTGGMLGTTNARAGGRNRRLEKGTYRLVMIADIHPEQSDVLLQGDGVGMPQRFLWMSARDAEMPEKVSEMPDWPGVLSWDPPVQSLGDITYPKHIQTEIRQTRLDANHGKISAKEAHANLTRLKVAYALAALHGEARITDQWWRLAGRLSQASLRLQEECLGRLQEIRQKRVNARVITERRAVEAASEDQLSRAVEATLSRLRKRPGEDLNWREAKPASRLRDGLTTEEILEALGEVEGVSVEGYEMPNGNKAWRLRYDE